MYQHNKKDEISVPFYKLEVTSTEGGTREDDPDVTEADLNILIMDWGTQTSMEEMGLLTYEVIYFQISQQELDEKGFTFDLGETHFRYNGQNYIVTEMIDYTRFSWVGLYECTALREITKNAY